MTVTPARRPLSAASAVRRQRSRPSQGAFVAPRPASFDFAALAGSLPAIKENIRRRQSPVDVALLDRFPAVFDAYKRSRQDLSLLRSEQKRLEAAFRSSSDSPNDSARVDAINLRERAKAATSSLATHEAWLRETASALPNESHAAAPVGGYDSCVVVDSFGSPAAVDPTSVASSSRPDRSRDHLDILERAGWLSFEAGSNATGGSFPVLRGPGALLEQALTQYALSMAVSGGWGVVSVPGMVRTEVAHRCGFAPRGDGDADQTFYVSTSEHGGAAPPWCLAATAEIPMIASLHSSSLPNASFPKAPDTPIRHVAAASAYRAEAGARGLESRGLYRVHQFTKVELVAVTTGSNGASDKMLQEMLALQKAILWGLQIPCRVLEMSTGELGASAYRKYDMEAWMPGRGSWGEVSSASNCLDYQARRLGIRHRSPTDGDAFAHTLNATAAAVPRLIVALVENGASIVDGEVKAISLPATLRPFWLGGDSEDRLIRWS